MPIKWEGCEVKEAACPIARQTARREVEPEGEIVQSLDRDVAGNEEKETS